MKLSLIEIDQIYEQARLLVAKIRNDSECDISFLGDDFLRRTHRRICEQSKAEMDAALEVPDIVYGSEKLHPAGYAAAQYLLKHGLHGAEELVLKAFNGLCMARWSYEGDPEQENWTASGHRCVLKRGHDGPHKDSNGGLFGAEAVRVAK